MDIIAKRDRAEYMRARRENLKIFSVEVEKQKLDEFEKKLKEKDVTKTKWLNENIDHELKK